MGIKVPLHSLGALMPKPPSPSAPAARQSGRVLSGVPRSDALFSATLCSQRALREIGW